MGSVRMERQQVVSTDDGKKLKIVGKIPIDNTFKPNDMWLDGKVLDVFKYVTFS